MQKLELKAEKRKIFGHQVKKLRREGKLPGNIYGRKIKSQALTVSLKDFMAVYKQAGETNLVELVLGKAKSQPILIRQLQKDPVSDLPLHADFYQVDLKQKVQVAIPIVLIGEAPAVVKGGLLVQQLNEIEVEALPTDLLDKFEVDVSKIKEVGQGLSVKDIKVDRQKIKLLIEDENRLVVNVELPKEEKEEIVPTPEAAVEEGAPVEGEAAPGEEKKPAAEPGKPEEAKPASSTGKPAAPASGKPQEKK